MIESEQAVQDRKAADYEDVRYRVAWSRRYHESLFAKMWRLLRPHGCVLDVGCGTGMVREFLTPRWRAACRSIQGLDLSSKMVRYARTRLDGAIVGSAEDLPYADATFDSVFARSILHHLPHPDRCIDEIARVVRPGGRCVFLDTNSSPLSRGPRGKMAGGRHFSEDHQEFDDRAYVKMLSRRFRVTRVEYVGFLAYALLGFPDVLGIYRFMPGKAVATPILLAFDEIVGSIPGLRRFGLGIMVIAETC